MNIEDKKKQSVQNYYGKVLKKTSDLKTNACCTLQEYPSNIKRILNKIHPEVKEKYYGCGLTIPTSLSGLKVIDLGSGSGRDSFLTSALVSEDGEVVGIDMTEEQLEVANKHISYHTQSFGYNKSNVKFLKGDIGHLDKLDLSDNYFDLAISNCVINLVHDKRKVIDSIFHLLKEGGEFYFSDVYADRRVPKTLYDNEVLHGECLSGALYWRDFINISKEVGFKDPRIVDTKEITVENSEIKEIIGDIKFYSITFRLFKVNSLELSQEDYAQEVMYLGTIDESSDLCQFDQDIIFPVNKKVKVSSNTFHILQSSRLRKHFQFFGDTIRHLGGFPAQVNLTDQCCGGNTSCC